MSNKEIISKIFVRLTNGPFDYSNLINQIIHDGGDDINPLTQEDLVSLLEQRFVGNWNNVAFSFSELLSYYSVQEKSLNKSDIVAWCFVALTMGEVCRKGAAEWNREFAFLITGFEKVRTELEVDEALFILRHVFAEVVL